MNKKSGKNLTESGENGEFHGTKPMGTPTWGARDENLH